MTIDMQAMLAKIKDRQWALADIDWDAPGAETIRPEFRPKLKAFMADLCWIENIGARGFAALAKKAPDPTLAEIYRYFHAEEQRHANAELALMKRWGMLDDGELRVGRHDRPQPRHQGCPVHPMDARSRGHEGVRAVETAGAATLTLSPSSTSNTFSRECWLRVSASRER